MATVGQKRKLEDTDIETDDNKPTKQQKVMSKEETEETKPENDAEKEDKTEETTKKDNKSEETTNNKEENKEENKDDKPEEKATEINGKDQGYKVRVKAKKKKGLDEDSKTRLREQLEFYFGDSNLSLDKFINDNLDKKGFFPVEYLLKFQKVREFTTNLYDVTEAIVNSDKLQLSDNKNGVKRHPSLGDPPTKQDIYGRTIFAKGFHPRMRLNHIRRFWEIQAGDSSKVLSTRLIKQKFAVGLVAKNEQKTVHRFLVCVLFAVAIFILALLLFVYTNYIQIFDHQIIG